MWILFYFLWNWTLKWRRLCWRLTQLEDFVLGGSVQISAALIQICVSAVTWALCLFEIINVGRDLLSSGVDRLNTVLLLRSTQLLSVLHYIKKPRIQICISSAWVCSCLCSDGGWTEIKSSLLLDCGLLQCGQIKTFLWPTDLMTWFSCTSLWSNRLCMDVHLCCE